MHGTNEQSQEPQNKQELSALVVTCENGGARHSAQTHKSGNEQAQRVSPGHALSPREDITTKIQRYISWRRNF